MRFSYDGGEYFLFNQQTFFRKQSLGTGSFGEVFCFAAKDSNTRYAVKCETMQYGRYPSGNFFEREANWYKEYYGVGFLSGDPNDDKTPHCILMPYFEGKTLYEMTHASLKHVLFNWIWAAVAVDTLHTRHHAVHGDVKTNNFIAHHEEVRLIDFGFTTVIDHYRPVGFHSNTIKSLYHQAPELFSKYGVKKPADVSQDLYSLGILLRDMCELFMIKNNNPALSHEQREKINLVVKNLSFNQPKVRWSIAKGIFILIAGYLTHIPRNVWNNMTQQDVAYTTQNVAELIPIFCKNLLDSSIQVRIEELNMEKCMLHSSDRSYRTKEKKIIRLLEIKRALKNSYAVSLKIVETAQHDKKLTSGVFQHRTKDMLHEMGEVMRGLQQLH